MNFTESVAKVEKEILAEKQRGDSYEALCSSELQIRKCRDNQLLELNKYIEELEYYIEQHWIAKGWVQKLEK